MSEQRMDGAVRAEHEPGIQEARHRIPELGLAHSHQGAHITVGAMMRLMWGETAQRGWGGGFSLGIQLLKAGQLWAQQHLLCSIIIPCY